MDFLREHQLNIMLFMSGLCAILAFMTLIIESPSAAKKRILTVMELSAMFLLVFDRFSYIYRGDTSDLAYIMVRVSNGLVFFIQIFIPHLVTQYLKTLFTGNDKTEKAPFYLRLCDALFYADTLLIVISQFTGLYYIIDEQNIYRRSSGYVYSYVLPLMIVLLQILTIIINRKRLSRDYAVSLIAGISMPSLISIVQIFSYGLSLTSIGTVFVVIIFYACAILELNKAVKTAQRNELETYKAAEKREAAMFEQTAEALANAIDAKDQYTHGHSTRVADISVKIARKAGFSDKDCRSVYFAALLHDIGKIGIPDRIINKDGKLTDEEFGYIKQHPILGYQILSSIRQSPELSIGAHYHHERYDGRGYPDGLSGKEIPETARIIAVADAYDAMTSTRSYREKLSMDKTKVELRRGMGSQFDPKFAAIMLQLIDDGEVSKPLNS